MLKSYLKNNGTINGVVLAIVVFVTVFSQMPLFVQRNISSTISVVVWSILFLIYFINKKDVIRFQKLTIPILMVILFYSLYCMLVFIDKIYLRSYIPRNMAISIGVLIIGNLYGNNITKKDFNIILTSYVIASVLLSIDVYRIYFLNSNFIARIYLYDEKNSTALILFTALIIIYLTKLNDVFCLKILYIICGGILSFMVLLMRCRAVYIGAGLTLLMLIQSRKLDYRLKMLLLMGILGGTLYFTIHPESFNTFVDNYLLAGRNVYDLDDLSSGRWHEWQRLWYDLGDSWLLGYGRMKRESLVLTSILEFGIPLGLLIVSLAIYPLFFGYYKINKKSKEYLLFMAISISYVSNMLFEQLAPFGPGAKCFFMWFLMGILSARRQEIQPILDK